MTGKISIDLERQIAAVDRRVGTRELGSGEARVSSIAQTYQTTVEDLWDACTSAERIPRWFMPVTGDLREGGTYQLEGNASGTIQTCDAPRSFTATWEFGGQVSWIEVRLSEDPGGGARLELEHVAEVPEEFWAQFGPGATGVGWDLGLLGLAQHLATGASVAPEAAEEWAVSAEGRTFATASSTAWAEASIAAGTPREEAKAAADRTTEFYTVAP